MEVKMNKEIRDYQESMFFGLNFRQCAFSVLAILAAVAIYFGTKGRLPDDVQMALHAWSGTVRSLRIF